MRESTTCPKCRGRRIWRIEKVCTETDTVGGKPLRVILEREMPRPRGERGFFGSTTERKTVGRFDLYLCGRCGFSELYAHDFEGLVPCPERGVHLLDAEAPRGAYR